MDKLTAGEARSDGGDLRLAAGEPSAADPADSRMVARVRLMMVISGLTTLVAIAAVVVVIGYRVFRSGDSGVATTATGVVMLPKGARIISSAVAGDRIVVTVDVAGATEIRTFDLRTLKETGRIRFATEP